MKRVLAWGFKLILAAFIVLALILAWIANDLMNFRDQAMLPADAETQYVQVKTGSSVWGIARQLRDAGLIAEPRDFVWLARWLDHDQRLQAGEYEISPGMTPLVLLARMVTGEVVQHSLTIIEGWSFRQMLAAMHDHDKLAHTLRGLSDAEIIAKLNLPYAHPEGLFMPDTYRFTRGTTDLEFLQRAHLALMQALDSAWAERDEGLPLKTPYEALILASIIEKETGIAEERPDIAGVFIRRLHKRMRLQTDPTVIYGMGDSYDGNIRRRDLRTDTPYNTYTRHGLPPTPIALPSAAAIRAAVSPATGKTLYFVATGSEGRHYFSETLEEHNQAVYRYQIKPLRDKRKKAE